MSELELTQLDDRGHLFGEWKAPGPVWCLGCGCSPDTEPAAAFCPEAEEMAADIASSLLHRAC